ETVTIDALTSKFPMGVSHNGLGSLDIVVSMDSLEKIKGDVKVGSNSHIYLKSKDPMKTQREIEEMEKTHLYVYNAFRSRQREDQMLMLMSVFTYGFIILITAISIANILNTISTSISLRKREFAVLKSVGMTPRGFNKMINYESIFYG